MTFAEALERVIDMQRAQIQGSISHSHRPVKYIIYSARDQRTGQRVWTFRESPCPECNKKMVFAGREVTGTIWRCKKHQAFWDRFWAENASRMIPSERGDGAPQRFAGGSYYIARMEDATS